MEELAYNIPTFFNIQAVSYLFSPVTTTAQDHDML